MEFKRKLIIFGLIFMTTLGWSEDLEIRNFSEYEKAVFTSKTSYSYDKLVSFLDNPKLSDLTVELEDTPNPQKVSLDVMNSGKIRIEILEVYPGTKYEDTCITNILCNVF